MVIATTCIKYLVLGYAIVQALLGVVIVVLASITLAQLIEYSHFLEDVTLGPPILVIACGVLSWFLSALSWRGTLSKKKWQLTLSSWLLGVMAISQLSTAVWALILRADLAPQAELSMQESLATYLKELINHDREKTVTATWDSMQHQLQCCGVSGPTNFRDIRVVPYSCCTSTASFQSDCHTTFQRGCVLALTYLIQESLLHVTGIAFIAVTIQVAGVLLSCCMSNSLENDRRRSVSKVSSNYNA